MSSPTNQLPGAPAGWYTDPLHPTSSVRYWDGSQWTSHTQQVAGAPVRSTIPACEQSAKTAHGLPLQAHSQPGTEGPGTRNPIGSRKAFQVPTYRAGDVVNGHVLNADGTKWLPVSASTKTASDRTLWVVLGMIAAVVVAVFGTGVITDVRNQTTSSTAGSSQPTLTQTQWVQDLNAALADWNDAALPIAQDYTNTSVTATEYLATYQARSPQLQGAVAELSRLASTAAAVGMPADIISAVQDVAAAYEDKLEALEGIALGITNGDAGVENSALQQLNAANQFAADAAEALINASAAYDRRTR